MTTLILYRRRRFINHLLFQGIDLLVVVADAGLFARQSWGLLIRPNGFMCVNLPFILHTCYRRIRCQSLAVEVAASRRVVHPCGFQ